MVTPISIDADSIHHLDLSAAEAALKPWLDTGAAAEPQIRFQIDFPRDPSDPRELSEIPEVRLWFVRLDARYPWLPLWLDWESGELARYAAMLVPHQFGIDGIQFNPEALELFVMHKVFVLMDWMQQQGKPSRTKLKFMTQLLGYELEDNFFDFLKF